MVYSAPSVVRRVVGMVLRLVGEPFRSAFTPGEMLALLRDFGLTVVRDDDLASIADGLSAELQSASRILKDLRIVIAAR